MKAVMKKYSSILVILLILVGTSISCRQDLLNQVPTVEVSADVFWQTVDDAESAMYSVYTATRDLFHKHYAWDGASDIMNANVRNPYSTDYLPSAGAGTTFNNHWNNAYAVVNRANFTLEGIEGMLETANESVKAELNRIKGDVLFLRVLAYFKLTDLWGAVPYYTNVLDGNKEAYTFSNTPRNEIVEAMLQDLDAAKTLGMPVIVADAERGRVSLAAIYGLSGKIRLYQACWAKLDGKTDEAMAYYRAAATDLAEVMKPAYGRNLYMNGEPGDPQSPNYYDLFNGLHEYNPEVIFAIANAGPGLGLGDYYVYDFGSRNTGNGGTNVLPNIRLMNRYQRLDTGDYAPALVVSDATDKATIPNGACNPDSYVGRDYRMYATCLWDGQTMLEMSADGLTAGPRVLVFQHRNTGDGYVFAQAPVISSGYMFRKYIRQYSLGSRENGAQDTYLMRLPDVMLMYCEAVNEYNNGPTGELFDLVDRIRHRGALPPLDRGKFSTKETFFKAVEQERIVELIAEGHRFFDIRRWGMVEEIWPAPNGQRLTSTWGESDWYRDEFRNATDRDYQRFYLFKIPDSEIRMNSNLKQNDCWL
jgi:hypothetical protein